LFFYNDIPFSIIYLIVSNYTHIDADGLSSGAILGKALYRAKIPFQITILRQLEKEEIVKNCKEF